MSDELLFILAYGTGIGVGIFLTLWWQLFGASLRRQMWDNYSQIWDTLNQP